MFIIRDGSECGIGDTLEEAIDDFQVMVEINFDPDAHIVYEANEVQVKRTFEIVKEQP